MSSELIDTRNMTFEQWVKAVFAHPVSHVSWHWDVDFREPSDEKSVEYMTHLFSNAGLLDDFLDSQVSEGLNFLISSGLSNHMCSVYNEKPPVDAKLQCLDSFTTLFEKCFAPRCTPDLSHLSPPNPGALNGICYMWWDIIPMYGHPENKVLRQLDEKILSVMEKTLNLDSIACHENALHGLGHWHRHYPAETESIIDAFIKRSAAKIPGELRSYAMSARTGCVN